MDKLNIVQGQNQRIFFTSDPHYGHDNVIRFCNRPYEDSKIMNQALIDNWNSVVTNNDIVFVLGDFCWFTDRHGIKRVGTKLNGKTIYFVQGNHDKTRGFELLLGTDPDKYKLLSDIAHVYVQDDWRHYPKAHFELCLCHYPLLTWSHRQGKCIQLFGHIHSAGQVGLAHSEEQEKFDLHLPLWAYQYDVGVDANDYRPVELSSIMKTLDWPNRDWNQLR